LGSFLQPAPDGFVAQNEFPQIWFRKKRFSSPFALSRYSFYSRHHAGRLANSRPNRDFPGAASAEICSVERPLFAVGRLSSRLVAYTESPVTKLPELFSLRTTLKNKLLVSLPSNDFISHPLAAGYF